MLPLIIILPLFLGIDGILYSAPIADFIAFIVALVMAAFEFRNMKRLAEEDNIEAR